MSDDNCGNKSNSGQKIIQNQNDVLCGRGSGVNSSPGNIYFRKLVRGRKEEYKRAKRHLKIPITKEIISKIKSLDPPGRFLVKDEDNEWKEYTNEQAMVKTAQALREGATKAERNRMILNSNKQDSPGQQNPSPQVSSSLSTSNFQQEHFQNLDGPSATETSDGAHLKTVSSLGSGFPTHSTFSDGSFSSNAFSLTPSGENNKYIQAYMHRHKTQQINYQENGQEQRLHASQTNLSNSTSQNNVASLYQVRSHTNSHGTSDRFDDAEEQIDTSLKILMESVQMRRRRMV